MAQSLALSSARPITASLFDPINQFARESRAEGRGGREVRVLSSAEAPTIFEAILAYLKEASGVKNAVFKTIACLSDWVFTFCPDLTAAKRLSASNKAAKNWAGLAEIPGKTIDVVAAGSAFTASADVYSFGSLINKIGLLLHPAIDLLKVSSETVSPLTAATLQTVATVADSALVFTTSYGTVEEMIKINKQREIAAPRMGGEIRDRVVAARDAEIVQSWLKIGMSVNYFAIGFLGLAAVTTELAVAPWVTLAFATAALIFTISAHLQKKISVEPAQKKLETSTPRPEGRVARPVRA